MFKKPPVSHEPPKCGQFGLPSFWRSAGADDIKAAVYEGMQLDCIGIDGNRPIHFAAVHGNEACVGQLLEAYETMRPALAPLEFKNDDRQTPFQAATLAGNVAACRLLYREGDPLNLVDAVKSGSVEMVELFLDLGAAVQAEEGDTWSPLLQAIFSDQVDLVECLVRHGADINYPKSGPMAPVYVAAGRNPEVLRFMLESGADPNANTEHQTPLTHAALSGPSENIILLLEAGSDPSVKGRWGKKEYLPVDLVKFRKEAMASLKLSSRLSPTAKALLIERSQGLK